ncbi:hypothetical protein P4T62_28335 [Bacillus mycoides]|uniref:hypothetical protein n=1 Tax=Bacillus mycoides TaxID=1405 RepID=UPI002E234D65|nr:hypothetical protein [Bacillus mycoides]
MIEKRSEELHYDVDVRSYLLKFPSMATRMGLTYDDTYLKYYNHICPRCKNEMKVTRGIVDGAGMVGFGVLTTLGYLCSYVMCKKCARDVQKETNFTQKRKAQEVEEFIGDLIPHLSVKSK